MLFFIIVLGGWEREKNVGFFKYCMLKGFLIEDLVLDFVFILIISF